MSAFAFPFKALAQWRHRCQGVQPAEWDHTPVGPYLCVESTYDITRPQDLKVKWSGQVRTLDTALDWYARRVKSAECVAVVDGADRLIVAHQADRFYGCQLAFEVLAGHLHPVDAAIMEVRASEAL